MAHEMLGDVLRAGDDGRARRRGVMLPLSIVVHAVAVAAILIVPLAAEVEPPAVARPAPRVFHVMAAPPAPVVIPARGVAVPRPAIVPPSEAPVGIQDEIDVPPPVTGALPAFAGLGSVAGASDGWGSQPIGSPAGIAVPLPPLPHEPVRVGGSVEAPRKIVDVTPVYPPLARAAHREGVVILEALIDEQGRVDQVRVLRSVPLLDEAAVQAVRRWRYTPTLLNGVPVPVLMTVTVRFTLH